MPTVGVMISNGVHAPWRRGREVLDDYDCVLSEELADDLVNELACLRPRRRVPARVVGADAVWATAAADRPRPRLRVLRGGLADLAE